MEKVEELKGFFKNVDEDKRSIAYDTIEEYVYALEQMKKLKEYPFIRVSKNDNSKQEQTPAAKLYKDFSQTVDNKRKILLMILYRVESSAAEELVERLAGFEIR